MRHIKIYGYESCPYYQKAVERMCKHIGDKNKIVIAKTTTIHDSLLKFSYTPIEYGDSWLVILESISYPIILVSKKIIREFDFKFN